MPRVQSAPGLVAEVAEFLSSRPSREQLLDYHPSEAAQRRAEELLQKQNDGEISREERHELEEFALVERLMRLVKARLRVRKPRPE
ncbi:MAG TPA: hypothetical protein VKI65_07940 [Gemmataceae bacterium]|nr:hypothetical protein [Gemmataceae bacterium]